MNSAEKDTIARTLERCGDLLTTISNPRSLAADRASIGDIETLIVRIRASLALLKAPEGAMTPDMEADLIPTDRLILALQRRTSALLVFGQQGRGKTESGYLRAVHGEPATCIGLAHSALVQSQMMFDAKCTITVRGEGERPSDD